METTIRKIENQRIDEAYYEIDHRSGLKILVYPKENFANTCAMFGTRYGSLDTEFRRADEPEFTRVPAGIAHYLEHKLFESEDLDAFARYAKTGASANAFTSFGRTCYYFTCAGRVEESLEILLDFVTHPYFTEENVRKEQGIIGQEIQMGQDRPGHEILFMLLRSMYHNCPVRIDIGGSIDSIAQITPDLLYRCYDTFYNFSNMVLCLAGNVDMDRVLTVADRMLQPQEPVEIIRKFHEEPRTVKTAYAEKTMAVSMPLMALGFKEAIDSPERTCKESVLSAMLESILCDTSTDFRAELLDEGLIGPDFDAEYFHGYGYATMFFTGKTNDPQRLAEKIVARIRDLQENGISDEDFARTVKSNYGSMLMGFNDMEDMADDLMSAHFAGYSLFDLAETVATVTKQDLENRLRQSIDVDCRSLVVIKGE